MRETTFTPGPWAIGRPENEWTAIPDEGPGECIHEVSIVAAGRSDPVCMVVELGDEASYGSEEFHANARLIAAAPDYHEAAAPLVELVAEFSGPDDATFSVTAGELRALAKAHAKAEDR